MTRAEHAAELFANGYNCAQAVAIAFCDLTGFSKEQTAKMLAPFGGGFGRLREVCGAVSGMTFVYGCLYGYEVPNPEAQMKVYETEQALAAQFKEKAGSIICREILKNPLRPRSQPPDRRILHIPPLRADGVHRCQHFGDLYYPKSACQRELTNTRG